MYMLTSGWHRCTHWPLAGTDVHIDLWLAQMYTLTSGWLGCTHWPLAGTDVNIDLWLAHTVCTPWPLADTVICRSHFFCYPVCVQSDLGLLLPTQIRVAGWMYTRTPCRYYALKLSTHMVWHTCWPMDGGKTVLKHQKTRKGIYMLSLNTAHPRLQKYVFI
jgi:hypothetical protein